MNRYVTLLILLFCFNLGYSQVSWRQFPHPNLMNTQPLYQVSVEFGANGELYVMYFDAITAEVKVDVWSPSNAGWMTIYSKDVSCCITLSLKYLRSRKIGSTIYFSYFLDDSDFQILHLAKIDAGGNVTELIDDIQLSLFPFNFPPTFHINEATNTAIFAYNKSAGFVVESFDFSAFPGTLVGSSSQLLVEAIYPELAYNSITDEMVLAVVDAWDFSQKWYTAPTNNLQTFTLQGVLSPSLLGEDIEGPVLSMAEKLNTGPDLLMGHEGFNNPGLYRQGLNSSASDFYLSMGFYEGLGGSGFNSSTFVFGKDWNENVMCIEILEDGTFDTIAKDVNPILQNVIEGQASNFVIRQKGQENILAGYFYGDMGPTILRTNTPPVLDNYTISTGICTNVLVSMPLIKNIWFSDAEEDFVTLDQVFSSDQAVIANGDLTIIQAPNGSYTIEGLVSSAGTTTLELWYTDDGVNVTTSTIEIEVSTPLVPEFTAPSYSVCSNGNILDLMSLVDYTGGSFSVGNTLSPQDDVLDPSELDLTVSPGFFDIEYGYSDGNGCYSLITATLTAYLPAEITTVVTNSSCNNPTGSVIATVTNPNGNYISYWNNGDQGATEVLNVPSGNYIITVIDDQGCIAVGQGTVLSNDINASATIIDVTCHNGQNGGIDLNISGTNPPFHVFWSNGKSGASISDLKPGIHEAIITDASGCQVTYSYFLPNPPKMDAIFLPVPPSSCSASDGMILFSSVFNANGNLSYEWSLNNITTPDLSGISNGIYFVEVTDEEGCKYNEKFMLNSMSDAPSYQNVRVVRSTCGEATGAIELSLAPTAGESITDIQWSNGMTAESIYNVPSDYYECVATQSNGCQGFFSWTVGTRPSERPEICIVTVDSATTTNLVVWEKPITEDIHHYKIYRETSQAGLFELIDTVHYSNISVFNDVVASPKTRSWRYRISSVNQCGIESPPSKIHKTIHVVTQELGNGEVRVVWDNYEGVNFATYDVYRYTDVSGWDLWLDDVAFNALPFENDTPPSMDGLDYMIEIDPGFICTATFGNRAQDYNSSRSNKAGGEFVPGDGTGDPNNSLLVWEMPSFTAQLFPNPNQGEFQLLIDSDGLNQYEYDLTILSVEGKVVFVDQLHLGLNNVQLAGNKPGVYFVTLNNGEQRKTLKMILH
jgi:hypothetical protein